MAGEWQAPKAAWTSADAVTTADLDRMDRINPEFLRDNMGQGMGYPRSVAYDPGTDTLTVTFDPVQVRFGGSLIVKGASFSHPITPVAINTTYYVFLSSSGATSHNTTGAIPAGSIPLCQVAVGATKSTLTLTDLRGTIDVTGKIAQDNLDAHKAGPVLDHPDGSVTTAKIADGAVTAAKVAADVATQAELDAHAGVTAAGAHGSATAATANTLAHRDANGDLTTRRFVASATQGIAPLGVTSTTVVPNFNADMVDGLHAMLFMAFGDGSDGDATIAANTTLTRDMYYNNLTINSGVTLCTGGYRLFVKGTLTNNGTTHNNGGNGVNATAGPAASAGTLRAGTEGALESSVGNGIAAANVVAPGLGGNGGAGGNAPVYAGGAGGVSARSNGYGSPRNLVAAIQLIGFPSSGSVLTFGGGGGGGGGARDDGTAFSGAGGGGGGAVLIAAREVVNSGQITANGGAGGAATGGNNGGGGGGGGGVILILHTSLSGSGTITANGGAGGAATGTAAAGAVGGNGSILLLNLSN